MSKLVPKYTMWEALNAALSLGQRALDEIRTLARTPGPAGKDGRDGIGFDGVEEEYLDGGRFLVRRYKLGDKVISEQRHVLGTMLYRGLYQDGKTYLRGDTVTFSGSTWHCDAKETTDRPKDAVENRKSESWTLTCKRGSDGKDGKDLISGPLPSVKIR